MTFSNPILLELVSSHVFLFELITTMSDHYWGTIAVSQCHSCELDPLLETNTALYSEGSHWHEKFIFAGAQHTLGHIHAFWCCIECQ